MGRKLFNLINCGFFRKKKKKNIKALFAKNFPQKFRKADPQHTTTPDRQNGGHHADRVYARYFSRKKFADAFLRFGQYARYFPTKFFFGRVDACGGHDRDTNDHHADGAGGGVERPHFISPSPRSQVQAHPGTHLLSTHLMNTVPPNGTRRQTRTDDTTCIISVILTG